MTASAVELVWDSAEEACGGVEENPGGVVLVRDKSVIVVGKEAVYSRDEMGCCRAWIRV